MELNKKQVIAFLIIVISFSVIVSAVSLNGNQTKPIIDDIVAVDKFNQLKRFKQIGFGIDYDNITVEAFDKETLPFSEKKIRNKFKSQNIEVESIYEEIDTSFFNVDERPIKQSYILRNLLNTNKNTKLNILYEIDSDFVVWNRTKYVVSKKPIYFKAFEVTKGKFPGLNKSSLTGHTLTFGNNYYNFKDITDLNYSVSVYSFNNKNYINLEVNKELEGLEELFIDPVIGWTARNISVTANGALSVYAADLDNDQDIDVISSVNFDNKIEWYQNNGGSTPSWTNYTIKTDADRPIAVFAIDLDKDNDTDVIATLDGLDRIEWYENIGGSPINWVSHIISSVKDPGGLYAIDIDNDSDIDVVSESSFNDRIEWYENKGGSPLNWTTHIISTNVNNAWSVYAKDIDKDNDIDVVSASLDDNRITWYENNGSSPPNWTVHNITTSAAGASSVFAIDIDGDNDIDVVSVSVDDNKIAWYENNGSSIPNWTTRIIATDANGARSVFAIDLDKDNDIDVLSASEFDDKIAWYENNGSVPPNFIPHNISITADGAWSVFAIDIDKDNDTDVLSASQNDDKVIWYESNLTIGFTIQEIIPIQVIKDVDLVKGKTTLVRSVIKNNFIDNKNITISLFFENTLKNSTIETINAGQEKNIDLNFVPDVAGSNKEIRVEVT
ncbi:VCBS repeat-containing protein [Candidatus Woesearchaeota archaeon]|nr:VCBS repeat-containing protein [Candidatus Woesearchaeota archaeon]